MPAGSAGALTTPSLAAAALTAAPFVPAQQHLEKKPPAKLSSDAPAYVPPHARDAVPEQQLEDLQPAPDDTSGATPDVGTGDWAPVNEPSAADGHSSAVPPTMVSVATEAALVQPAESPETAAESVGQHDTATAAAGELEPAQTETSPLSMPAVAGETEQSTATEESPAADDAVTEEADDSAAGGCPSRDSAHDSQGQGAPACHSPASSPVEPPASTGAEVECECRMFSFGDFEPVAVSSTTTVGFPTERLVPVERAAAAQLPGKLTFGNAEPAGEDGADSGFLSGSQDGQGSLSLSGRLTVSTPAPVQQEDSLAGDASLDGTAGDAREGDTQSIAPPVVSSHSNHSNHSDDATQPGPDGPGYSTVSGGAGSGSSATPAADSAAADKPQAPQPTGDGKTPSQPSAQAVHHAEEQSDQDAGSLAAPSSPETASAPKPSIAPSANSETAEPLDSKPSVATAAPSDGQHNADDGVTMKVRGRHKP